MPITLALGSRDRNSLRLSWSASLAEPVSTRFETLSQKYGRGIEANMQHWSLASICTWKHMHKHTFNIDLFASTCTCTHKQKLSNSPLSWVSILHTALKVKVPVYSNWRCVLKLLTTDNNEHSGPRSGSCPPFHAGRDKWSVEICRASMPALTVSLLVVFMLESGP